MRIIRAWEVNALEEVGKLRLEAGTVIAGLEESVRNIVGDVRERGDEAVLEYAGRFDGYEGDAAGLRISAEEIDKAHEAADGKFLAAFRQAAQNVREFQKGMLPEAEKMMEGSWGKMGIRFRPMGSAGVYSTLSVSASSLYMCVVPAQVAGVKRIAVATPARKSIEALAGMKELGISEAYGVGGAQAIAALAYGTETIPKVDMVAGPGKPYVTYAKRLVYGDVGVDLLAGPSELAVLADDTADPELVAADMISQAEHAPGMAVLVTDSESLAGEVGRRMETIMWELPEGEKLAERVGRSTLAIVMESVVEAIALVNEIAPEHAEVQTADSGAAGEITNAGAIFVGRWSPVPIGDYAAGPSHLLPTDSTARAFSGVSVYTFLKRVSYVELTEEGFDRFADVAMALAEVERLYGHKKAVEVRKARD